MTTYRIKFVIDESGEPTWVVMAIAPDGRARPLSSHATEVQAQEMADFLARGEATG